MKQYVNDPDDQKTDSPPGVPNFIHKEVVEHLAKIERILHRNLTPENKVKAIVVTFANTKAEG